MGQLSTYRVGGRAKFFTRVSNLTSLESISELITESDMKVLIVGNGSNLLISDSGFDGLVIQLGENFENISVVNQEVTAGGAASLPVLARYTVKNGLSGLEWAVGVPGTVGGAVRMNAGGHGASISDSLLSATIFDLQTKKYKNLNVEELKMEYRSTVISNYEIVVDSSFSLDIGNTEKGDERISEIVRWRRENQPGGQNAGSVFMNPLGDSAGRLIDATGLKGYEIGSAMVSEKHANFIQVKPNGSADDVYRLMKVVHARVLEETGVSLETETVMVGFD
jgi:UDP-N-acetylmuramate dehydrogenase